MSTYPGFYCNIVFIPEDSQTVKHSSKEKVNSWVLHF